MAASETHCGTVMRSVVIAAMREAGFTSVFIGIETTDPAALKLTQKRQNVGVDVREALEQLTAAGMEVMAGFIVGFDGDGSRSFEAQRELLRDAPLPLAMTGLLTALPGTALWRRLEREGRLRDHSDGDAFARPNFEPTMPERELVEGYAALLEELYSPERYFRRSSALVDRIGAPAHPMPLPLDDVWVALRAIYSLGIRGSRRTFLINMRGHANGAKQEELAVDTAREVDRRLQYGWRPRRAVETNEDAHRCDARIFRSAGG